MTRRRGYGDRCGVARALDVVGERWSLLVVRELLLGPKRFTDLRHGLPRVSAEVLGQRLTDLTDAGVVRRRRLPPPAASTVYELTARGRALESVVIELGRWGADTPPPGPEVPMSADSHLLSLLTLYDPGADDPHATIDLRLDERPVTITLAGAEIHIADGEPVAADATVRTTPATLLALIRGRDEPSAAETDERVRIDGDRDLVGRFWTWFPTPAGAGPTAMVG